MVRRTRVLLGVILDEAVLLLIGISYLVGIIYIEGYTLTQTLPRFRVFMVLCDLSGIVL